MKGEMKIRPWDPEVNEYGLKGSRELVWVEIVLEGEDVVLTAEQKAVPQ
jgi:hypothetical protein